MNTTHSFLREAGSPCGDLVNRRGRRTSRMASSHFLVMVSATSLATAHLRHMSVASAFATLLDATASLSACSFFFISCCTSKCEPSSA